MPHHLQDQFEQEIIKSLDNFEGVEVDEEKIESLLDEVVVIDDPSERLEYMTGQSLHNTKRQEPIHVELNASDAFARSSAVIGALATPNLYVKGAILLLLFLSVRWNNAELMKPNQALTYGVGWEISHEEKVPVDKDALVEEVINTSYDVEQISDMTEKDVEQAIQELRQMKCIKRQETNGDTLLWFEETFDVEYSFQ